MSTRTIFCKNTSEAMSEIREGIIAGSIMRVFNEYETVYGVGFETWLRVGVEDIATVDVAPTARLQCVYGYPNEFIVRPKRRKKI